jgi:hypothetical protein
MSQTYEFYAERAREAAAEAAASTLDNVRERNERAQKMWTTLAEQARSVRTARERTERAKASARAEAEAEAEAEADRATAALD